jgi:hypothetical protein
MLIAFIEKCWLPGTDHGPCLRMTHALHARVDPHLAFGMFYSTFYIYIVKMVNRLLVVGF